MSNPWDIPPFPVRGDADQNDTYAGVGRVLSQWEAIEVELSHVYSLLVYRHEDLEALREYGRPTIFRDRLDSLQRAAERYFQSNPHQETESEFSDIAKIARNFSARKNDVAHSIVRPYRWTFPPSAETVDPFEPMQFCATPPHYSGKKFMPENLPIYVYTSVEMNALSVALFEFSHQIIELKWKLMMGEDGKRPESE
jgi:hypothetical protein